MNWTILVLVLAVIVAGAIYAVRHSEPSLNSNTLVNANAAANINGQVGTNTNSTTNLNANVDTSGWKTYSSSTYGFSVKMPESWKIKQSSVNRETFKYESFGFSPGDDEHASYQVNVYNSVKDLANGGRYATLSEWIAAQATGPYHYPSTDFLGQGTYEGYVGSADKTYSFYIERDGKIYNVDMSWISPETRETDPLTRRPVFSPDEKAFLKSFKLL